MPVNVNTLDLPCTYMPCICVCSLEHTQTEKQVKNIMPQQPTGWTGLFRRVGEKYLGRHVGQDVDRTLRGGVNQKDRKQGKCRSTSMV